MLAAAALLLGAAAVASPPLVGLYHDDGVYVGTALSLARGDGLRIPHLPETPPQTKYPPLYPVLLTPVAWATGGEPAALGAFRWPSVLATWGALALLPGLFRRWGLAPGAALGAVAATAAAPLVLQHALFAMSEAPFLFFSVAALRLLPERGEPVSTARGVALGACAGAALLVRTIGVALLPALAFAAWSRRREPGAWIALALAALCAAGWWLAAAALRADAIASHPGPLYGYYLGYGDWIPSDLGALGQVLSANLRSAPFALGDALVGWRTLGPVPFEGPVALLGLACLPGWVRIARRAPGAALYGATSLGLILAFPFELARYLVPLTPLLAAGLFAGGAALLERLRAPAAVGVALGAALVSAALAVDAARFPRPDRLPLLDRTLDAGAFLEAADWLRAHTRPDDLIVSDHDPWVYLATGRQALPPGAIDALWPYRGVPRGAELLRIFETGWEEARRREARWLLLSEHWHPVFRQLWQHQMDAAPQVFRARFTAGRVAVYAIRPLSSPRRGSP